MNHPFPTQEALPATGSGADRPAPVGTVADRAVLRAVVVSATTALMLMASGCGRKQEVVRPAVPSAQPPVTTVAPEASPPQPPKTAVQERMESPEYVATLKTIHAERQVAAGKASELQAKMAERAKAFEAENQKASAIRAEIETLHRELAAKETALADLVKQDPEWGKMATEFEGVRTELVGIGQRVEATVREKMRSQVVPQVPGSGPHVAPPGRPAVRLAPTNSFEVVPRVVTNAPAMPPTPPPKPPVAAPVVAPAATLVP